MNGKEVKQWPICLAVRRNCHRNGYNAFLSVSPALTSSPEVHQKHFDQIGTVLAKKMDETHCRAASIVLKLVHLI